MKLLSKIIFIFFFVILVFPVFGQSNSTPADEEEFNLFLFSMLVIFFCVMIGAAIIGAMLAALFLSFVFSLMALGVLSTSIAIGLYKKSFSTGFKSFIMIIFGISCSAIGGIGLLLVNHFFDLHVSSATSVLIGISSGSVGGLLMAIATFQTLKWMIKIIAHKLRLA